MWFALAPFNFGPTLLKSADPIPHFFVYLAAVYFLVFFWAAVSCCRKIFYGGCAVAHATLMAEIIYLLSHVYHELSARPSITPAQDAIFMVVCPMGFLCLIFFLPSLIWALRWADWRDKDSRPAIKAVAVMVSVLGLCLWLWMIFATFQTSSFIAWPVYFLGGVYFLALFWAALAYTSKRFFISFVVAQLILGVALLGNVGASLYAVSQFLVHDQDSALVEKTYVGVVTFFGSLGITFIISFAVFFLPTLIWGVLAASWLKPGWFKKVDFSAVIR